MSKRQSRMHAFLPVYSTCCQLSIFLVIFQGGEQIHEPSIFG